MSVINCKTKPLGALSASIIIYKIFQNKISRVCNSKMDKILTYKT